MTKLSTAGTSSCATIALQGFKPKDKELNNLYLSDPKNFILKGEGYTVDGFYEKILYPNKQELGRTFDYPFELLMETIMGGKMKTKLKFITLNASQNMNYWPEQLAKWGFICIDKTNNSIGEMNYLYIQSPNRPVDMSGTQIVPRVTESLPVEEKFHGKAQ